MAGCEYLANIERVGLKVALKHMAKHGSFLKTIEHLQKEKTFKDRIPSDYIQKANLVADLFQMQTVYNLRDKELTQLGGKLTANHDADYLGDH